MPKTIELTDHAFARIKAARQEDESWSEVIERLVPPKRTANDILKALKKHAPSMEVLDAAAESANRRRRQRQTRKV